MEHIWSPWRYKYITSTGSQPGCVFCNAAKEQADNQNLIVHRGTKNFVILNRFPYTSGHLMVLPYEHESTLHKLDGVTTNEMMDLAKKAEVLLQEEYKPDGFNIGLNLGQAAGAGIAGHVHLHVVPRWSGDANFVSSIGETRILPEELTTTYERLVKKNWD